MNQVQVLIMNKNGEMVSTELMNQANLTRLLRSWGQVRMECGPEEKTNADVLRVTSDMNVMEEVEVEDNVATETVEVESDMDAMTVAGDCNVVQNVEVEGVDASDKLLMRPVQEDIRRLLAKTANKVTLPSELPTQPSPEPPPESVWIAQVLHNEVNTHGQFIIGRRPGSKYTDEKTYSCDQCDLKFPSVSNRNRHRLLHSGERTFACGYCDKTFVQRHQKLRHEIVRHTHNYDYHCDKCQKQFMHKSQLVVHYRNHTQDRPFECPLCKKTFTSEAYLTTHKLWHSGERNHECDICLKRFVTAPGLHNHRAIHSGVKPHRCAYCNRGFLTRKSLVKHERLHRGDLPHTCGECGKGFPDVTALGQHQMTHSDTRPFTCKTCCAAFKTKTQLRSHALVHTNYYPFKCDVCPRRYRRKDSLLEHEFTHTGVGRFRCFVCEESFARRKILQEHTKTHKNTRAMVESVDSEAGVVRSRGNVGGSCLNSDADGIVTTCVRNVTETLFAGTAKSLVDIPAERSSGEAYSVKKIKTARFEMKTDETEVNAVGVDADWGRFKNGDSSMVLTEKCRENYTKQDVRKVRTKKGRQSKGIAKTILVDVQTQTDTFVTIKRERRNSI